MNAALQAMEEALATNRRRRAIRRFWAFLLFFTSAELFGHLIGWAFRGFVVRGN